MRRVAEQADRPVDLPRGAPHRAEYAHRVVLVVVHQVRGEPDNVRVVLGEVPWIAAGLSSAAKLPAPWLGQNKVQVKERSGFGNAIIIEVPRGQMCRASGSRAKSPPSAGMVSSL
ncbi:hypothetical protein GCM10027614_32890 [Micromonospora vulcania]